MAADYAPCSSFSNSASRSGLSPAFNAWFSAGRDFCHSSVSRTVCSVVRNFIPLAIARSHLMSPIPALSPTGGSHSGSAGVGPGFKALAGSSVSLSNGQTVTADDVYLQQSIADPDAQIVKGYRGGVMPAAIARYDLDKKPNDIRALVAFIKSTK